MIEYMAAYLTISPHGKFPETTKPRIVSPEKPLVIGLSLMNVESQEMTHYSLLLEFTKDGLKSYTVTSARSMPIEGGEPTPDM